MTMDNFFAVMKYVLLLLLLLPLTLHMLLQLLPLYNHK